MPRDDGAVDWRSSASARVTYDEPFNWSRVNNLGADHATGDHLLFLNDDTEVDDAGLARRDARVLAAAGHRRRRGEAAVPRRRACSTSASRCSTASRATRSTATRPSTPATTAATCLPHNCAAVTGACLMTRRDVFDEAGGFDESFPLNYNDVDYCLRVRKLGYRVVFTPHAQLMHHESVTKAGVFEEELDAFRARWGDEHGPVLQPESESRDV